MWQTLMDKLVAFNDWAWGPPMLIILFGGGIWMTVACDFVQFKHFGFIIKETLGKLLHSKKNGEGTVSAFQATTSALANTVGASNIVGVPVAIARGGPGAIFWMWAASFFGLAIKWAEISLGVAYRKKDKADDTYVGGPPYYLEKGLGLKWLGLLFAICLMLELVPSVGTQAVTAAENAAHVGIPAWVTGGLMALLGGLVVFGGIRRIGSVTEKLIPFMVIIYLVVAWVIIILNITKVPAAFGLIFGNAFSPAAAVGGFEGATVAAAARWGVARGVYSNECGMGQAAIAHAPAITDHPARQGCWAIFEVIVDTFFVCTTTAIMTMVTGLWKVYAPAKASIVPMEAIGTVFGSTFANYFVNLCLFLFVLSTVIGNCFYGEQMARYIGGYKLSRVMLVIYIAIAFIASLSDLGTLYNFTDFLLAIVVAVNVIGVCALSKKARALKRDFFDNPKYVPQKHKKAEPQEEVKEEN